MRSADVWAIALGSNVIVIIIIIIIGSLAPFEQAAQAVEFFGVDAGFFESV
jgi:hypothetical protein